ncbi:MAG: FAD-binding oxidoreductase [Solirubrobacteraceae bacterium]
MKRAGDPILNLRRDLSRIVGAAHVLDPSQLDPYTHDATIQRGLRAVPDAVVRPADAQELTRVLAWCYEHELPIVARGGGSGLAGGALATEGGVICSTERLTGVLECEPQLWRISVQAGLSTANVQRLARENGLLFAPDPGAGEQSQIGGNVATNAAGPHAFKYGPTGAWVSGLQVALAPGELVNVGSHCRKDVGGYDLRALLVGSEGTLGIITAVSLTLTPAPALAIPLAVFLENEQAAQQALLEIIGGGLQPAVLDFLDGPALAVAMGSFPGSLPEGAGFLLLVEFDGSPEQVDAQLAEFHQLLAAEVLDIQRPDPSSLWRWRSGLNGLIAGQRGGKISEDICVPPEHLGRASTEVTAIGARYGLAACCFGHAGDGIIHATFMVDLTIEQQLSAALQAAREVFELALRLGGSVTGEHGIGVVKRGYLAAQLGAAGLQAHRQIKRALDPKGLLNPGTKDH